MAVHECLVGRYFGEWGWKCRCGARGSGFRFERHAAAHSAFHHQFFEGLSPEEVQMYRERCQSILIQLRD